jgi:hypothetical protein
MLGDGASAPEGPVVVTVRVDVPPGLTDVGETVQFTPIPAGAEQLRVTALPKPPRAPTATPRVEDPPGKTAGGVAGDIVTEKSGRSKAAPTD